MNIGIDIVSISRIRKAYNCFGKRFTDQFLTTEEKQHILTPEYISKCWAVKEAAIKASNILDAKSFSYTKNDNIPLLKTECSGKWSVSVSDEKEYVVAIVIRQNG